MTSTKQKVYTKQKMIGIGKVNSVETRAVKLLETDPMEKLASFKNY